MKGGTRFGAIAAFGIMLASSSAFSQETPPVDDDLLDLGQDLYGRNCVVCHGANGEGGEGPAFAGSDRMQFASAIIRQVLFGGAYMPPFANLSDEEIAGVATYIRNTWGNAYGGVTPDQVAAMRE